MDDSEDEDLMDPDELDAKLKQDFHKKLIDGMERGAEQLMLEASYEGERINVESQFMLSMAEVHRGEDLEGFNVLYPHFYEVLQEMKDSKHGCICGNDPGPKAKGERYILAYSDPMDSGKPMLPTFQGWVNMRLEAKGYAPMQGSAIVNISKTYKDGVRKWNHWKKYSMQIHGLLLQFGFQKRYLKVKGKTSYYVVGVRLSNEPCKCEECQVERRAESVEAANQRKSVQEICEEAERKNLIYLKKNTKSVKRTRNKAV